MKGEEPDSRIFEVGEHKEFLNTPIASGRMRISMDSRNPYREILQHHSLICHQLLGQNASQLQPYHASEQVHREDGLRTWLRKAERRAEAERLILQCLLRGQAA